MISQDLVNVWHAAAEARGEALTATIVNAAPELQTFLPDTLDARAVLAAFAWKESSYGRDGGHPRIEPAYRPGGKFHRDHVVALYALYGDCAAASWSSWQIMFPAAVELGFVGEPWGLWDDKTAVGFVIHYLYRRALKKGASTIEQLADAYNSGSHKDRFVPIQYLRSVREHYDRMVRNLDLEVPLGP